MVLVICSGTILAAQGGVEVANLEYHLSLSDSDRLRLLVNIGQRHSFQSPSLVLALWAGCAVQSFSFWPTHIRRFCRDLTLKYDLP